MLKTRLTLSPGAGGQCTEVKSKPQWPQLELMRVRSHLPLRYRKGLCSAVTLVIQGDRKDLGQGHPGGSQAPSPLFRNTETPPLSPSEALVKWVSAQQPLLFFWKLPLTLL